MVGRVVRSSFIRCDFASALLAVFLIGLAFACSMVDWPTLVRLCLNPQLFLPGFKNFSRPHVAYSNRFRLPHKHPMVSGFTLAKLGLHASTSSDSPLTHYQIRSGLIFFHPESVFKNVQMGFRIRRMRVDESRIPEKGLFAGSKISGYV